MIEIGNIYTIKIEALSASGSGVGFIVEDTKRAIFIPYSVPGDKLKVKINAHKKAYFEGEIIEILEASEHRIDPVCPYFMKCGACDWLNIAYDKQVEEKKNILNFIFSRKNIYIPDIEVISAKNPLYYRDKIRLKNGFYAKKSNEVIAIKECHIIKKDFWPLLSKKRDEEECYGYCYKKNMVTSKKAFYYVNDLEIKYLPSGFVQNNLEMNTYLVNRIIEEVEGDSVLELYCGNGNITLPLSTSVKSIDAIEGDRRSFSLLNENLVANNITNVKSLHQDSKVFLDISRKKWDCIIMDPPRKGAEDLLSKAILRSKKVIYVSCNANQLASEIKLSQAKISKLILVDMFPQTRHFEVVAIIDSGFNDNK